MATAPAPKKQLPRAGSPNKQRCEEPSMYELLTWQPDSIDVSAAASGSGAPCDRAVPEQPVLAAPEPAPARPAYRPAEYSHSLPAVACRPRRSRGLPRLATRWTTEASSSFAKFAEPSVAFSRGSPNWDTVGRASMPCCHQPHHHGCHCHGGGPEEAGDWTPNTATEAEQCALSDRAAGSLASAATREPRTRLLPSAGASTGSAHPATTAGSVDPYATVGFDMGMGDDATFADRPPSLARTLPTATPNPSDSRWFSNTKFGRLFSKPPFGMYGNGNRRPTDGGVFDGGYMSSHNIMPLMHPANPKAEAAMEMVRFTNDAAVLRYDPTRYASESGVRPGEEGEAAGPDEERLMVTARMALEEEYGAAVAERVAKRAEERARAEREKAEQAKPPPSAVDDSKRRNPRRAGVVRSGWGSGAEGDNGEGEDSAGAEAEAAAAAAAKAAKEDALGLHASLGRDARTMGYVTGFVSDLAGMPGRGYDSSRVRDMLVWDVEEEAEEEGAEEDVTERDVEAESKQGESAPNAAVDGGVGPTPVPLAALLMDEDHPACWEALCAIRAGG
ncbi:hypothetical protein FNF29_00047 [Cafeteria roenbergensis]|uniref:Uncharacterized protein n=1 Tax=Cafeteria roenbergensis TaxID=33653 RepID=A0A5A8D0E8_CAFRO|nr:hypothetical protein FNF29_00047 [Cafeteria roenbergensis]|eukprot:KAA0157471.1 hypothetical protein FNF29_00047 [Cafeteria roenbergensis]